MAWKSEQNCIEIISKTFAMLLIFTFNAWRYVKIAIGI